MHVCLDIGFKEFKEFKDWGNPCGLLIQNIYKQHTSFEFGQYNTCFIAKVDIGVVAIARLTLFSDFLHKGVKTFVKLYFHLDKYLYQRI